MFCFQCEQTVAGTGCTGLGVCGKTPEVAGLQDLVVHAVKGLAQYAHRARVAGATDEDVNICTAKALFSTSTNVDFDPDSLRAVLGYVVEHRERARQLYEDAVRKAGKDPDELSGAAAFMPAKYLDGLLAQAESVGITARRRAGGEETVALEELVTYGVKGIAAYADRAGALGRRDDAVYAFIHEALCRVEEGALVEELVSLAFKAGEVNLRAMELLDAANTDAWGHPEPTRVRITPVAGKCILVSGHDLKDLDEMLKQTEGQGLHVYTHGEMLPANGYPGLRKYGHLVGNYGSAWHNQYAEFEAFPGAILMTSNCLQKPKESHVERIFTSGQVGWPGAIHVHKDDFSRVINAALAAPGFLKDEPERFITVGFGRDAVLGMAEELVAAVKAGRIRRFFLIAGCDGARPGRNYYTKLAEQVPSDCVILTLACGKYRLNRQDFGAIGGIPRLLDVGQCNDAYSVIRIAQTLADAFKTDVNGLPLSLVLSWYEQKAVAVLLTLLHLGFRNIRLGPSLPAFVTPHVLKVLKDKFNIQLISTPEEDLAAMLGTAGP